MEKRKPKEKGEPKGKGEPEVRMIRTATGYMRPERSVRCSSCLKRITIEAMVTEASCPYCDMQYRIYWVTPDQPLIRGPVWSVLPPPGPWPPGWPGELDSEGRPVKRGEKQ